MAMALEKIICPLILRLLGRISRSERGKGDGHYGEENQDQKMGMKNNIKFKGKYLGTLCVSLLLAKKAIPQATPKSKSCPFDQHKQINAFIHFIYIGRWIILSEIYID